VKYVLLRDDSQTFERKLEEASMALQVERQYSKDRILELYLNAVYFGNGAYGVQTAAQQYFGRPISEVTLAEGALLAGLIQRPSATDPYDDPAVAVARRNVVLERMRTNHLAPDEEIDAALAEPLTLGSSDVPAAERYEAAYFVEEVKQWILDDPRFGETPQARRDLLFGGGLRIQTTVDLRAQAGAEAAAKGILPGPADPDVSLVSIEPSTGYVRAMVGGRDFFGAGAAAKFNLATQGLRQAGSSFKPVVLATALAEGMSPSTTFSAPACIDIRLPNELWSPCNYAESGAGGAVDLVEATVRSINTVYAQLIMDVGAKDAMELATSLGVRSPLEANPASALGTNEVTALDMAAAYATFANRGVRVPPVLVTRITRPDGTVLFRHQHTQERAIDAEVADTVTSILQQAVTRGTGGAARLDRPVAGKTGTADDHTNAWFAGFTPDLATAVWVGFQDENTPMEPPRTAINVTGGSYPARIWQRYMSVALEGRPVTPFHAAGPLATTTTSSTTPFPGDDDPFADPGDGPAVTIDPTTGSTITVPRPVRPPRSTTTSTTKPSSRIVRVPSVVGMHVNDATATLRQAGFTVRRHPVQANVETGSVVSQSPPGGSLASEGTQVVIGVVGG
jgi:penicillin-binding protein 1A